jgi:hypothetical protein
MLTGWIRARVKGMTDSGQGVRSTYRLLDRGGDVIEERDLPTDGEALAWAEHVRRHHTPRVFVRRLERRDGEDWRYVSPAGDDT